MAADMESNTIAQYSPLNNLSSGEEIEQFSLPVAVNVHKPKRRRKRKEFDSLKAQSIAAHKTNGVCKLSTCLLTLTFISLVALVCGLSVLVYQLYIQVHELQKQVTGIQNNQESQTGSLSSLMSQLQDEQQHIYNINTRIPNINHTVETILGKLDDMRGRVDALERDQLDQPEPADLGQLRTLEEKLAQFGSDITTLQTDMATVQQTDLSFVARLSDLDKILSSLQLEGVDSGDSEEGTVTTAQVENLRIMVNGINRTVSAQMDSMNGLISRSYTNYSILDDRLSALDTEIMERLDIVDQDMWTLNFTVHNALSGMGSSHQPIESTTPNGLPDMNTLTERVDQLESSLHEIYLKQSDKITSQAENQVVNVTISKGLEDIITRVITDQVSSVQNRVDGVTQHSAYLEARILQLEANFNGISHQMSSLVKSVKVTSSTNSSSNVDTDTNANTDTNTSTTVTSVVTATATPEVTNDISTTQFDLLTSTETPVTTENILQSSNLAKTTSGTVVNDNRNTPSLSDLMGGQS